MDDEEYGEDQTVSAAAQLNWADLAFCVLAPVRGLFEGCHDGVQNLMTALVLHSNHIGERQEFQRDAGRAIESLARGED